MNTFQGLRDENIALRHAHDRKLSYSIILAGVFSIGILIICYPGFMSYDSIRMLEEARSTVRGGIYPTTPVYLLRMMDIGGYGPTVMLFLQNFLSLLSLTIILDTLRVRWYVAVIALTLVVAMPTVLGCMLVLWKDVTTAATLCISIAMTFWASRNPGRRAHSWAKWGAICFLILSTLVRFNAATSSIVIAVYWIGVFYGGRTLRTKGAIFLAFLALIVAANKLVNEYTFPDFRKLGSNPLAYLVMAYDFVGISKWANHSYIPICTAGSGCLPKASISDIDNIYSSLGAMAIKDKNNLLKQPVRFVPPKFTNTEIASAWIAAIKDSPIAYLQYRTDLFAEIIGAKPYKTFEPTHFNRIDENPFGIKFVDRGFTDEVLKYIDWASGELFGKPWMFFILSLLAATAVAFHRNISRDLKIFSFYAAVASFAYIGPFFILSGSGEVRYVYPSLLLGSMPILVLVFSGKSSRTFAS